MWRSDDWAVHYIHHIRCHQFISDRPDTEFVFLFEQEIPSRVPHCQRTSTATRGTKMLLRATGSPWRRPRPWRRGLKPHTTPGMPSWVSVRPRPARNLETRPPRSLGLQWVSRWAAVMGRPAMRSSPPLHGSRPWVRARTLGSTRTSLSNHQTTPRRPPPPHHLRETLTVGRTGGPTNRAQAKLQTPAAFPALLLAPILPNPHLTAVIRRQVVEGDGAGRGITQCCIPPLFRCVTSPSRTEEWRSIAPRQRPLVVAAVPGPAVRQSGARQVGSGRRRNNKTQGRKTQGGRAQPPLKSDTVIVKWCDFTERACSLTLEWDFLTTCFHTLCLVSVIIMYACSVQGSWFLYGG